MPDPRFARLRTDPRFRKPKKHQQKVAVDERFKSIFDDGKKGAKNKSKGGGRVDKYGRRISDTQEKDNLRRFYRLEGQDDQDDAPRVPDLARGEVLLESSSEEEPDEHEDPESDDDDDVVLGRHASKPIQVLADEELEVDLDEEEDAYADLDAQAAAYAKNHVDEEETEEPGTQTRRLAVVNLDWDHVRASHLYRIFSSLVSPTAPPASSSASAVASSNGKSRKEAAHTGARVARGKILSVRVYPSDFGKERMKKEEVEGPPKEIFKKTRRDDAYGTLLEEDEGDEADEDALRKYQLERLRYYYAIVTCDSVDAARHLVSELDGSELERTANVFDLSYVPDDMTFEDDFRDEATPATEANGNSFKGLDFSTDALRHSKVKLKWDEDDPERMKILRRPMSKKEIEEDDYRAYIASSDSDDASEEGHGRKEGAKDRDKLRSLLLGGGNDELSEGWDADPFGNDKDGEDGEMEITFMPGLSESKSNNDDETTLEKYKRKQKEKRQQRKKERAEKVEQQKGKKGEDSKPKAVEDEFFGEDSDNEYEDDVEDGANGSSKVHQAHESRSSTPEPARPATEAELALLVAPDDASGKAKHFDMKAILKAEKAKGRKRHKKEKKGAKDGDEDMQEEFEIDVKDDRFKALHEDHAFAIDPSNPHFKKTKSMAALLSERTKRQSGKQPDLDEPLPTKTSALVDQSLQSLVESVKRKSSFIGSKGQGKRRKL